MIFRDIVRISKPTPATFGQKMADGGEEVGAIVEISGGLRRGGYYDALAGDARAYLDASNLWLISKGYDIGGYFLTTDKYGVEKKYRVLNAAIGEKFATTGEVSHIEVDLEEVK